MVDAYLAELDREAAQVSERGDIGPLATVYLGGGTPSHLRARRGLERVLGIVRHHFGGPGGACADEVTLEVHPSTVDPVRARTWVELGVTRLSVGAQSFDDPVLRRLGRPHDAAASRRAVEICRTAGATVSIDLITAVAGQDLDAELDAVLGLDPDHVSAYTLTIEPGTPFHAAGVSVNERDEHRALVRVAERLGAAGFERYEVSNHARAGARSEHNLAYWSNRCFLGLGPSAASHLPVESNHPGSHLTERHTNPPWAGWLVGQRGEPEARDAAALLSDGLLCGLRLRDGVDLEQLRAQTGLDRVPAPGRLDRAAR